MIAPDPEDVELSTTDWQILASIAFDATVETKPARGTRIDGLDIKPDRIEESLRRLQQLNLVATRRRGSWRLTAAGREFLQNRIE